MALIGNGVFIRYLEKHGVTASLGVTGVEAEENADAVFTRVDKALYGAKEGGRNRVVYIEK